MRFVSKRISRNFALCQPSLPLVFLLRSLDLCEIFFWGGREVFFATFAAEIDLLSLKFERVGNAHVAQLFSGDHAGVERVISKVQLLFSARGKGDGGSTGDDEFHGSIIVVLVPVAQVFPCAMGASAIDRTTL